MDPHVEDAQRGSAALQQDQENLVEVASEPWAVQRGTGRSTLGRGPRAKAREQSSPGLEGVLPRLLCSGRVAANGSERCKLQNLRGGGQARKGLH